MSGSDPNIFISNVILSLLLKKHIYFISLWLHWVFVAAHRLSLVAACRGCSLLCAGLLQSDLSCCRAGALEHRISSCGTQAPLLHGTWDLPRPGVEPVSPAVAGEFLTSGPPGKVPVIFLHQCEWANASSCGLGWRTEKQAFFCLYKKSITPQILGIKWLQSKLILTHRKCFSSVLFFGQCMSTGSVSAKPEARVVFLTNYTHTVGHIHIHKYTFIRSP